MTAPSVRRRAVAVGVAVVAAVAAAGCHRGRDRTPPEDLEVRVVTDAALASGAASVVVATEQELPQRILAAGRVAFDDQRVQHVVSPAAGRVTRVLASPGQAVRRGAPLVALASPDVGTTVSDLVKARADLGQAEAELARQRALVGVGAGPQRDLEAAQDAQRRAQAELSRARQKASLLSSGDVDAVNQELTLRSAIDGTVIARAVSPGLEVQGAYAGGTPVELFTIGDIDQVWVLAEVNERDLARVAVGAAATARVVGWPGREFKGTVQWVSATLDPVSRTGQVRMVLGNADHALRPEMLAQVSVEAAPLRGLVVPRRALVPVEGQLLAYVQDGEPRDGLTRFTRRRVRAVVDPDSELAAVEEGLRPGDRVLVDVTAPRSPAQDEVHVTPRQFERARMAVETVREQEVSDVLATSARVQFDDARVAHVFSPVTGRVTRVLAQRGDRVTRGAPLLALVSPDVGSAFSDALKAEADRIAAEHEAARQRELFEAHAGARKDLEAAQAALRRTTAEAERARQKTRLLAAGSFDAVTQEYTLRSPLDGEVVARGATPGLEVQGQWSGASAPVELFTIGALDPIWIVGDVYDVDLPRVRTGQPVEVRVSTFPERTFAGRVDWVADVIDPATRTAKIRCAVPNPDHLLRPEMSPVLRVRLPGARRLAVPRRAVLRLGSDTIVFVAAGTTEGGALSFRRRRVLVSEDRADGLVPVLDGLVPGEQVVTAGAIFLVGLL